MMMKKILYIIFILLLNSCYTDYKEIDVKKDNKVEIILNLNVPEQQRTRVQLSNADETSISNIRVFVFDANDKFKYEAKIASSVTSTTPTAPLYQGKGSLKVRLIKSTGNEKYKIVVIANIASDDDVPTLTAGASTYENLRTGLKFKSIQDYSTRKLPMWGENTIKIEENTAISLDMLRALARVDVGLNFDTYPSENAKGLGNSFSLKTVDVYNINEKGYYIPASANITSNVATNPSIPTGLGTAKTYTYGNDATATNSIVRDIYISESDNKGQTDDSKKTYIVIGGNYAGSTDITYYRLDFIGADGMEVLDVLRNYRYRFDIKKIGGSGYATKTEAASNRSINSKIDVVLSVWDESQGNPTARGSSRMVKYYQSYMLGIDTDKFTLFKEQGSEGSIMARTNWDAGWTAEVTEGGDWLEITTNTGSKNVDTALKFKTKSENTTGSPRVGKIRVSAGGLLFWDIEVTQGITPEVRLEILDGDTNEPISFFEVASTGIDVNSPKKIKLRWIPSDVNAVIKSQTVINADGYNTSNFTLTPETKSINDRYAEQIYNLTAGYVSDAFDEKNLNVEFMVEKDGVLDEKTLVLHQQNYNVVVYDDISKNVNIRLNSNLPNANDTKRYFMDGRNATIKIFANTPYKLEMIENKSVMPDAPAGAKVIEDYATSTHVGQDGKWGIPNFSNGGGERVILQTIDDIKSTGQSLLGYAKFRVTSIENKFTPVEFNVIFRSGKIQNDANSFIVKMLPPNTSSELVNILAKDAIPILIPLKRLVDAGRLTTDGLNQLITSGELKPKIYWSGSHIPEHNIIDEMEVVRSKTTQTSYLSLKPGKSQGNAVIGVKKAGVEGALWSWHIWKLDNEPNAIGHDINEPIGGGFMDRNLGAIYYGENGGAWACGLYYQWGRKDPFVSHHSYNTSSNKSTVYYNGNYVDDSNNMSASSFEQDGEYPYKNNQAQSLETAIKNPHILYYNNSDWYSPGDGNLWREDEKTIYDPCPYGWKVPSETQLRVLKLAEYRDGNPTKGRQFTNYGFWPYSGYINDGNGKFAGYNGDRDGEYLSSKSFTISSLGTIYHKATVFDFAKSFLNWGIKYGDITDYGRARAMSVRCVRYEAESNTSSLDTSNGNDY